MTALYHCGQPAFSCRLLDLGLGWRHTIVDEANFVSPWEASSKALELSFHLGTLTGQGTGHICLEFQQRPRTLQAPIPRPTFNEEIEVLIGLDDSLSMTSWKVAHDELCLAHAKPWGWYFSNDTWDYDHHDDCYRPRRLNRSEGEHFVSCSPGIITLRTNDAWHHPLPADALGPGEGDAEPDPDVIPDPIHAPRFIQDLMDLARRHDAFDELDLVDEIGLFRVRTWYLHHRDHQRNFHPRILEFEEDWRRWEIDIGSAWRDFIHPNEEIQIHVIAPDPYKGYMTRPAHADLVISQGHWLPRFSSVITVHKNSRMHAPHSFAIASSLERRVSGVKIATDADVIHWCNHPGTRCTITHDWNEIPFTLQPTHEVFAGQSLVIQIVDANPSLMHTGRPAGDHEDARQPTGANHHEGDFDMTESPGQHDHYEHSERLGHSPSGSSLHSSDLSLMIYRLEAPDVHCFSQGNNYVAILNAAIRACRLPRRFVRCFHTTTVTPVGVEEDQETAIILQTINDIPAGSADKLVLVDIEIHYHPLRTGLVVPAAHSRKVMKVNPHMHRNQLLLLTGLFDYCQLQMDRCTIFFNHVIWAVQDRRVLDIGHGNYFRIVVPPPLEESLDTEIAIGIARDIAGDQVDIGPMATDCAPSLSLWQMNALFSNRLVAGPTVHKTDPDSDLPWNLPQPPSRRATQRERGNTLPQGRFAPGDQRRLEAALEREDLIECEEEGRIIYLHTWFINHRDLPRCYDGRALRLTDDSSSWLEEITTTWIDLLRPDEPFLIRIVHPQPPCSRFECVQAHLLIEQAARPHLVAGLVSFIDARTGSDHWEHRDQLHSMPQ